MARRFKQAPTYLVQAHLIYNFQSGVWVSMDGIYFAGGVPPLNGVRGNNEQQNTRVGLTLAIPVNRQSSFKIFASTGTSTRTGSEFSSVGFAGSTVGSTSLDAAAKAFLRGQNFRRPLQV